MLAAAVLPLAGCQKYRPSPLVPGEVVAQQERLRHLLAGDGPAESASATKAPPPLTFARAVELLDKHSPALREIRAEYDTAQALAKVKTPLPNPGLEAGPQFGFGPDVAATHRLQPFGSLSFTLPTGGRLKRQDEVNKLQAHLARTEASVRQRELYLETRKLYSRLALGQIRVAARKASAESAEKAVGLSRKLIEAGQATSLDTGILELDAARARTEALGAENDIAGLEGELSELLGVHAEQFRELPKPALPELPASVPELKALQEQLVTNHAQLARLRAKYEVSERELHLEISKQYPDFHIGTPFSRDVGERKNVLGLTLGIELPVFDKNQQGIASASKRRDEIRVKYEAAANKALAALDRAWRGYGLAVEKMKLVKSIVVPKAEANLELARKSLQAGAMDSLRFLETERAQRAATVDAVETELSVREAWIELEQAVGAPLLKFPGEPADAVETLPEP